MRPEDVPQDAHLRDLIVSRLAYSRVAAGAFPEVLMLRCCSWLPGGALLLLLVLLGGALLLLLVLT